jgi:release factor glutamine methyltransferase
VAARLAAAGFLAAEEEAAQLAARAPHDDAALDALVQRRLAGEPLAWITGSVMFCDVSVRVEPGVYVPRPHTELLAWRAIGRLPERGVAVDLCTGSGAVAVALATHRPRARIVASDIDARAVVSARRNRVDVYHGDLFAPLPRSLHADVDVVTGVVPYVPTADLPYLQRDTFTFESALAYDGGAHGMRVLRRVVRDATRFLRPGGTLLLELGGDQPTMIERDLERRGYRATGVIVDVDGDVRGIEATLNPP